MKKFILVFIIFTLYSCEEDNTTIELTPITNTGANTFSCKVNGEIWIANDDFSIQPSPPYKFALLRKDSLVIYAHRASHDNAKINSDTEIFLKIPAITQTLISTLDEGSSNARYCIGFGPASPIDECNTTNNINNGSLTIHKLDTAQRIVSGTFYFTVTRPNGTIINVTDGRFDLDLDFL